MKKSIEPQPSKSRPLHALVVDDSEGPRRSVVALLKARGIRATLAASGADAIARLSAGSFDLLLTDFQMPGMNGIELLEWARDHYRDLPAVLMTGALTAHVARAAIASGAAGVLSKPFGPAELSDLLEQVFASSEVSPSFVSS